MVCCSCITILRIRSVVLGCLKSTNPIPIGDILEGLRHVIDIRQFREPEDLEELMRLSEKMESGFRNGSLGQPMAGKILAALFYEPSTRTKFSYYLFRINEKIARIF